MELLAAGSAKARRIENSLTTPHRIHGVRRTPSRMLRPDAECRVAQSNLYFGIVRPMPT
jgi:hypothetical protein